LTDGNTNCWYNNGETLTQPFPNEFTFKANFQGCSVECVQDIMTFMGQTCAFDSVAGRDLAQLMTFVDLQSDVPVSRQLVSLAMGGLGDDDNGCGPNCPVSFGCN
jgi:hypothetical protein